MPPLKSHALKLFLLKMIDEYNEYKYQQELKEKRENEKKNKDD